MTSGVKGARCDRSRPLHKTVDDLLLAGLVEGDGELVAVDLGDAAVAEFLVEDAVGEREFRGCAGGFRDQLALDRHRATAARREAAEIGGGRRGGKRRGRFLEATAAAVAATAPVAVGLRPLPARGRIARPEGLHVVEAGGALAAGAAPGRATLGFRDLDICRGQVVEEARRDRGRPGAVDASVGRKIDFCPAPRAGETDMTEPALFFQPRAALFVQRALAWEQAFLPTRQEHVVKFEPLGRM